MRARKSLVFHQRVLDWHADHGRHDLPWARQRDPYRVWLSEIMLQQTQVATVIPYFERFITRFSDVETLAAAAIDEVLHLWSGLGYYSRARNLHRAAQHVVNQFGGEFPRTVSELETLPGIGRSTAGAIVALAYDQRAAILDGNVKRVLARYHAVDGWPGNSAVTKQLWLLAENALPDTHYREYTQAMMDLGATLCTRRQPACERCPVSDGCTARRHGNPHAFPAARPRRTLPQRATIFLIVENETGEVLLERRPDSGIWGGLWCFPEMAELNALERRLIELGIVHFSVGQALPDVAHTFSHFRLMITPLRVSAERLSGGVREGDDRRWHHPDAITALGLSKPVSQLLKKLRTARV